MHSALTKVLFFAHAGASLCAGALAGCGDDTAATDATDTDRDPTSGDGGPGGSTGGDGGGDDQADASDTATTLAEDTGTGPTGDSGDAGDSSDSGDSGDSGEAPACEYEHQVEIGTCVATWERWGLDSPLALQDLEGDGDDDLAAVRRGAMGDDHVETLSGAAGATIDDHDAGGTVSFVRRVGDLDGDALDDLVVVVLEASDPEGEDDAVGSGGDVTTTVRALSSADLGVLWEVVDMAMGGVGSPQFVTDLAPTGDRDGDGVADVVLGRGGDSVADLPGFLAVWSGVDAAPLFDLPAPPDAGSSWPGRVHDLGADLDDDGVRDVLVGDAMGPADCFACGAVWALSGADGSVAWQIVGSPLQLLGNVLETADIDGDGLREVLVGDFYHAIDGGGGERQVVGDVRILEGDSGVLRWRFEGVGGEHDYLGISVGVLGDLDGDGVSEIGAGAYYPPVDPWFGPPARLAVLGGADGQRVAQVRDLVANPMTQLSTMLGAGLAPLRDGRFAVSAPRIECEGEPGYLASWSCTP
jgi:hypothetical protein